MSVACAEVNDQPGVFSFRALYDAYLNCRRHKRNANNTLKFEADLLGNLTHLQQQLSSGNYRPSRSVCFYTAKPKLREIIAADFRDRVVHHCLVSRLEKIFEPLFIYDSYACRVNKGTHVAVRRLQQFIRKASANNQTASSKSNFQAPWYLQLDIRSFFTSIDHHVLLKQLGKQVRHPQLMALAEIIIRHKPTDHCIVRDKIGAANNIPRHKSLFHTQPHKGLPIGNLSSQFFANVYLNDLDQFVKHQLKCRCYIRYVDDFILVHESPAVLQQAKRKIELFLANRLQLQLRDKPILRPCSDGIDFLGYITRSDYTLVRKRVIGNVRDKLNRFESELLISGLIGSQRYCHLHLPPEKVDQLQQTLASYLGHFKHADSYRLSHALFKRYAFLRQLFIFDSQSQQLVLRTKPFFAPNSLAQQQAFFSQQYPGAIVLIQLGRFCELFNQSAIITSKCLGLKLRQNVRGFNYQAGFPMRHLKGLKRRLKMARQDYIVVAQHGAVLSNGLKQRVMTECFMVGNQ